MEHSILVLPFQTVSAPGIESVGSTVSQNCTFSNSFCSRYRICREHCILVLPFQTISAPGIESVGSTGFVHRTSGFHFYHSQGGEGVNTEGRGFQVPGKGFQGLGKGPLESDKGSVYQWVRTREEAQEILTQGFCRGSWKQRCFKGNRDVLRDFKEYSIHWW